MKPLTIIGYIAYFFFAIMIIGLIPNFFFRFVVLVIFVAPVLRKLFMPKTVYSKYNKLLRLFSQTHRSFQITRNESEIVEFTLKGFEKDSLQYGSIKYNINAPIIDSGNFTINSKPRMYLSLHTTFKGIDISIEKNFYHFYDQTMMYDEIMIPYMKKVMEIVNNSLDDEDENESYKEQIEKNNKSTETIKESIKQSKPVASEQLGISKQTLEQTSANNTNSLHKRLSEQDLQCPNFIKEIIEKKGLTANEKDIIREYKKLKNEIYDGSKDYEINLLSLDQKTALLGMTASMCNSYNTPNNIQDAKYILENFAELLGLTNKHIDNSFRHQSWNDKAKYAKLIKTIHMDGPLIHFVFTCEQLRGLEEENIFADYTFTKILKDCGFSQEEINSIKNNKYIYKFNNNEDEDNDESQKSLVSKPSKQTESLPQKEEKPKPTIIKSWSLISFAKEFGPKMQVGEFVNSETKEHFKSCIFTKDNIKTYVAFSSKLGVLTPKEIVERRDSLKVVKLNSGIYSLCKDLANDWEEIDLGII